MFLAALVPLALKVTAAGGVPLVAQVYVRFASPASSAPSAPRPVVVPATGFGLAAAAVAMVGAAFGTKGERQMPESVPAKTLSLVAASDQIRAPAGRPVLNAVQVAPPSIEE